MNYIVWAQCVLSTLFLFVLLVSHMSPSAEVLSNPNSVSLHPNYHSILLPRKASSECMKAPLGPNRICATFFQFKQPSHLFSSHPQRHLKLLTEGHLIMLVTNYTVKSANMLQLIDYHVTRQNYLRTSQLTLYTDNSVHKAMHENSMIIDEWTQGCHQLSHDYQNGVWIIGFNTVPFVVYELNPYSFMDHCQNPFIILSGMAQLVVIWSLLKKCTLEGSKVSKIDMSQIMTLTTSLINLLIYTIDLEHIGTARLLLSLQFPLFCLTLVALNYPNIIYLLLLTPILYFNQNSLLSLMIVFLLLLIKLIGLYILVDQSVGHFNSKSESEKAQGCLICIGTLMCVISLDTLLNNTVSSTLTKLSIQVLYSLTPLLPDLNQYQDKIAPNFSEVPNEE